MIAAEFKEGDEVFGLTYGGAYAEYVAVSVKMIVHKPKQMSWETAAGIPEVWFTAIQASFLVGNLSKGQTVLFHAGASCNISRHNILKLTGSRRTMLNTTCEGGRSEMHHCDGRLRREDQVM